MDPLDTLASELGQALKTKGWMLALAESCTGGMTAAAITSIPGSSGWFDRGFVTYSNLAKTEMLGVSPETLEKFGAVSEETAQEMVLGALKNSQAQIACSITGIAGPDGGTPQKPVGTVCFAWVLRNQPAHTVTLHFSGDRHSIRQQSVHAALAELLKMIKVA